MSARFEHHGPDHHSPIEHAFDRAYREQERDTSRLTDHERFMIARARELGPVLSATGDVRDKLAGQLLTGLADLAERLDGQVWWLAGKIVDLTGPSGSTHPPDRELMLDVIRQAAAQVTDG